MFINHSNHPSRNWSEKQFATAAGFGEVIDEPFPLVPADWDSEQVEKLAWENARKIIERNPQAVLCQGEFTYTYRLIRILRDNNIRVLAACSERVVKECRQEDGTVRKESVFEFVQFREY